MKTSLPKSTVTLNTLVRPTMMPPVNYRDNMTPPPVNLSLWIASACLVLFLLCLALASSFFFCSIVLQILVAKQNNSVNLMIHSPSLPLSACVRLCKSECFAKRMVLINPDWHVTTTTVTVTATSLLSSFSAFRCCVCAPCFVFARNSHTYDLCSLRHVLQRRIEACSS